MGEYAKFQLEINKYKSVNCLLIHVHSPQFHPHLTGRTYSSDIWAHATCFKYANQRLTNVYQEQKLRQTHDS